MRTRLPRWQRARQQAFWKAARQQSEPMKTPKTTQAQIDALARPGVEEAYIRPYRIPSASKTPPRPFNDEIDDGLEARMEYFDYVEEFRKAGGDFD